MLVSVVETRGIEPLTPALQKHGVADGQMECAGRSDVVTGIVARAGRGRRRLAAIVAAIASTVDTVQGALSIVSGRPAGHGAAC